MRRSTIFSCGAVAVYLAVMWVALFVVAPANVAVADFVATAGLAIPLPSGWNATLFDNGGSPALHVTLTGLLALAGYGAVIAGCAFYVGEHQDVRAELEHGALPGTGRGAHSSVSSTNRNAPMTEGEGPRVQ